MRAGAITEYNGECWRIDGTDNHAFDLMVLDRSDRSPCVLKPDIVRCYLCRELIPHSELLHEDVIQHHIQANEMRDKVLNEIAAGIIKPEFTDQQIAAMIND